MKRIVLTATAASMLALGAPGMASAHHVKHHHGARHASAHKRHATRAHLVRFTGASVPGSPSGSIGTHASPATSSSEPAGKVTSFENGVLTITLSNGSPVSGQVTENTEIQCESASPPPTTTDDDQGGGDDQSGSDSGEHGGSSTQGQPFGHRHDARSGDDGDGEGDEGERHSCTVAALVPGAVVREAELRLGSTGAVWEKVDLIQ